MEIPAKFLHPGPGFHPRVPRCGTDPRVAAAAGSLTTSCGGCATQRRRRRRRCGGLPSFAPSGTYVFAALSMVYISGGLVVFVGRNQSYTNLKKLNVKSIARTTLK
ncbi:hypothetical protein PAHAL_4G200700 [Panicum hallii]|uniref:Uncharacterized protein n=1 Tax=Panicum hallii TaxID=206008 RepID=A0A2S3HJG7_9POAL|nr:hypothetical protein PAHAL_4G200700 [Panicum hallii]